MRSAWINNLLFHFVAVIACAGDIYHRMHANDHKCMRKIWSFSQISFTVIYKVIWKEKGNCIGKCKCDHLATRWCHINASMFSRHEEELLWIFIWSVKLFMRFSSKVNKSRRAHVAANAQNIPILGQEWRG